MKQMTPEEYRRWSASMEQEPMSRRSCIVETIGVLVVMVGSLVLIWILAGGEFISIKFTL